MVGIGQEALIGAVQPAGRNLHQFGGQGGGGQAIDLGCHGIADRGGPEGHQAAPAMAVDG